MIRSIKVKLEVTNPDALLETFKAYNYAYSVSARWGFDNQTANKIRNHNATYEEIRKEVPELPSSLLQCARDCACESLKRDKCKILPKRKQFSAMRYNQRVITVNTLKGIATIATVQGRIKAQFKVPDCYKQYLKWNLKSSTLIYQKNQRNFYLSIQFESPDPELQDDALYLGIDRGLKNIAVCSDNTFYDANHIRDVKRRYGRLKSQLQSKGTVSAKRKLKKVADAEKRFVTDVNHCLAKQIVQKPFTVFVLEDLTGIRDRANWGKNNKWLHQWSFYQLEQFIEYKAENLGKVVIYVDPKYTSQTCSNCGEIKASNRKGLVYKCSSCKFELHADLNASRNIVYKGKSLADRLLVNQPNGYPEFLQSPKPLPQKSIGF